MIPIGDDNSSSKTVPLVSYGIIAINARAPLYLWIFGDNVEDRFGHTNFIFFYLLSGLAASFAQLAFSLGSDIPNLGTSGAIAGVLGAYILMFP